MATTALPAPALRDPAWTRRVFWAGAAAVLLVPILAATEFKPWILFEPDNLKITLKFVGSFLPPKVEPEFLSMVAREA
jgi:phosphonate transport system permease protein